MKLTKVNVVIKKEFYMNSCDTKTGTCEASQTPQAHCESKCPCGCGSDHPCPIHMWMCSFHEAKKSVQVDILKAKIQKAWGPKLEKEATAVIEAMEAKWKSMQAAGQFKEQLKEKFEQICKESR